MIEDGPEVVAPRTERSAERLMGDPWRPIAEVAEAEAAGLRIRVAELEARVFALDGAARLVCRETDWCPVCGQNPSSGHHATCALSVTTLASHPLEERYRWFVALRAGLVEAGVCLACGAHASTQICQCENNE